MKYTLYYSVRNGGDGSAYPIFLESQELADWDQDHLGEGWGENCSGTVTLESESPIVCDKVISKEEYYIKYIKEDNYFKYIKDGSNQKEMEEFISKFFPEGLPRFSVRGEDSKTAYTKREVYLNDKLLCSFWDKGSNQDLEDFLNSSDIS